MTLRGNEPMAEPATEAQDRFHRHLDNCKQCSDEPFNLCPTGERLLLDAVKEIRES